ncbi:MAG TPA: PKD-like family lipoprotein [Niabella sp.]|nr:PKD-like family lipoprotein [Niabella sp.]
MKKYIIALLLVVTCLTSCYKDKGNYEYVELGEMKVEGIPGVIHLVRKVDRLVVNPKITSSKEGEIKGDNPNYSFRYRIGYKGKGFLGGEVDGKGEPWVELTPTNGFNLDLPFDFEPNNYVCWLTITDKRNNVVHSHVFDIQVTTLTYQGWMVLSHIGQEERVRLDMISHVSATRTEFLYDIAVGLPQIHHATQLSMNPDNYLSDEIAILSKEGSYILNNSTLESTPVKEFTQTTFLLPPAETMIAVRPFVNSGNNFSPYPNWGFAISDAGNAYIRKWPTYGIFGAPINKTGTSAPQVKFKVAPFVAFSEMRPGNSTVAIFYDRDNKRFMRAICSFSDVSEMTQLPDSTATLFPYKTGRDMVYMEGTRRSNGMVNAILQDAQGQRSIYGMRVTSGSTVVQDYYHENVTAPGFEQATLFAFDSQFPFLFYAVGNKVYLYVLTTKTATELTSISGGEITALKFNLYKNPLLTNLNNQTTEFMNQQFQLIVGSFDNSIPNGNGGKVAFYEVDGRTSTVKKLNEYAGFGKVKDVLYRERFK